MIKKTDACKPFQPVPLRITIGVTGHRTLTEEIKIREIVRKLLIKMKSKIKGTKITPVELCILSPLAEGADRLVVDELLQLDKNAVFKAVLPLSEQDYLEDFDTEESKNEFKRLLEKARNPVSLRQRLLKQDYPENMRKDARRQAYADVGEFVVDHCDILIAIWDKKASRSKGGTAEIVKYAKNKACPLCIIDSENPKEDNFNVKINIRPLLLKIDKWNKMCQRQAEKSDHLNANKEYTENQFRYLFPEAIPESVNLASKNESVLKNNLIPSYVIASGQAKNNQTKFLNMGNSIFWLAFSAVLVVAFGEIFLKQIKWAYLGVFALELLFLTTIVGIVLYDKYIKHYHKNWIESRFLAERIRSGFFHYICRTEIKPIHIRRRQDNDFIKDKWMFFVYEEIWNHLPKMNGYSYEESSLLSSYIQNAWVKDQMNFHKMKHNECRKKFKRMELFGELIFYLAFAAAFCHIMNFFHTLENWLTLAALALPALAATLEGIRSSREYHQLAVRSKRMEIRLNDLSKYFRLMTPQKLEFILNRMEQLMLEETQDWLALMRPAELYKVV